MSRRGQSDSLFLTACVLSYVHLPLQAENYTYGPYVSVQVNVNGLGENIAGDEANTPSIAVDPNDSNRIVIGWRDIYGGGAPSGYCGWPEPCLRRNGFAYSHDGGQSWSSAGVIEPDQDRTLPVLGADHLGNFYYMSKRVGGWLAGWNTIFKSSDGGATWDVQGHFDSGGYYGETWMAVDALGSGTLFVVGGGALGRSSNGGQTFDLISVGAAAVASASDGTGWAAGRDRWVGRIDQDGLHVLSSFCSSGEIIPYRSDSGGPTRTKLWIAASPHNTAEAYILAPVEFSPYLTDLEFSRTDDGGATWSAPIGLNDDSVGIPCPEGVPLDFCRFGVDGMMSVAPNGRLDVAWTRGYSQNSYILYRYSYDGGNTWSPSEQVSPEAEWSGHTCAGTCFPESGIAIASHYYNHMVSTNDAAHITFAAPLNLRPGSVSHEWDVFYLRVDHSDCNENGIIDGDEVLAGSSPDCNFNTVPDECEIDWDFDGAVSACDNDDDNDGVNDEPDLCNQSGVGTPTGPAGNPAGDYDENCCTNLVDFLHGPACLNLSGPFDVAVPGGCRQRFDLDLDLDVDLDDFHIFQRSFDPTTCVAQIGSCP